MPPKKTYEFINNLFTQHNCNLLYNKTEFNDIYLNAETKLKIIAKCGHEHLVSYHRFSRNKDNIICVNCNYLNVSKTQKIKKEETIFITKHYLETYAINYLKKLTLDNFDIKRTFEGCKADIGIKPKILDENKWLGIQIKSTYNKVIKKNNVGYNFSLGKDYTDMIIICIAIQDKLIWIFENNDLKHLKSVLTIRNNSKYDKYKIDNNLELTQLLFTKYKTLPKFNFEYLDIPESNTVKIEYEYRKIRENKIDFLNFIQNENECEVYDFKIGDKKIQEKVSSIKNINIESYTFNLQKTCCIKKNKKRTRQNYKIGDCDIYWFHCKNSTLFYVIPENILIEKGLIENSDGKIKSLTISNTNKNTFWTKDFKFDYNNLDKQKLCKILL